MNDEIEDVIESVAQLYNDLIIAYNNGREDLEEELTDMKIGISKLFEVVGVGYLSNGLIISRRKLNGEFQ